MNVGFTAHPQVAADLADLGSAALQREALGYMKRLRREPLLGRPLGKQALTGDLSDCRKIFFNGAEHRIVYRLLPDERKPQEVYVIVVGPRAGLVVYKEAVRRLGRSQ